MRQSFERRAVAAIATVVLLAGCASGPAPPPASPPRAMGNGQPVRAAAWAGATPFILVALDSNGDGVVSAGEIETAQGSGLIDGLSPIPEIELLGLLAYTDRNGDGRIDAQELSFFRTRVFVLLDRNRDGRLDFHELDVAEIVVG